MMNIYTDTIEKAIAFYQSELDDVLSKSFKESNHKDLEAVLRDKRIILDARIETLKWVLLNQTPQHQPLAFKSEK